MFIFGKGVQGKAFGERERDGHDLEILCFQRGGRVDSAYKPKEFEVDFMVFGRWRLEHYGIISLLKLSIDESTPRGLQMHGS